jgi:hypothetical protein
MPEDNGLEIRATYSFGTLMFVLCIDPLTKEKKLYWDVCHGCLSEQDDAKRIAISGNKIDPRILQAMLKHYKKLEA